MTVTITKEANQLFAKNKNGELLKIHGLVIPKKENDVPKTPAFYEPSTSFFKAACPEGTTHRAEYVSAGLVNIY